MRQLLLESQLLLRIQFGVGHYSPVSKLTPNLRMKLEHSRRFAILVGITLPWLLTLQLEQFLKSILLRYKKVSFKRWMSSSLCRFVPQAMDPKP